MPGAQGGIALATQVERRELARLRLLESAARVFAQVGYAAATLERIAREAGYAKGTVYLYFADKADLFLAVMEDRLARQQEALRRALAEDRPLEDAVTAALDAVLGGDEDPRTVLALGLEFTAHALRGDETLRHRMGELYAAYRGFLTGLMGDAQREGRIDPVLEPQQLAAVFVACADGVQLQRLVDPEAPLPPSQALARVYLRLLGAAPGPRGPGAGNDDVQTATARGARDHGD